VQSAEAVPNREESLSVSAESALTAKALAMAKSAHAGQSRKDGSAYVRHPQAVAETLESAGFGDEIIAAALLHDVVERSEFGLPEVAGEFGVRVGELVSVMTEDDSIDDYVERKHAQRRRVATAGPDAVAIFAADKLANLIDVRRAYARDGEAVGSYFDAGLDARIELWHADLEMAEQIAPTLPYLRELRYELESLEEDRAGAARRA
jgi:(p)ppGpp synthase/HD superfamily hydrolase